LHNSGLVREELPLETAPTLSELELQSRWFAGEFGREFTTTCGRRIEIVQFGIWNQEAGPDFIEAAVHLEGRPVEGGSIELDLEARGWEQHGHAQNPAFAGTRLHLFLRAPDRQFFTRTCENRLVPQVRLDLNTLEDRPGAARHTPPAVPGRCIPALANLSDAQLARLVHSAAHHRLRRKGRRLRRIAAIHGAHQALFEGLAQTLGYKENQLAFALLAQRFPLKFLRRKDLHAEALLFGSAGFLGTTDLSRLPGDTRDYLRQLWEHWWPHRATCERHMTEMPAWKLGGVRPVNHPQRRLAALAVLAQNWPRLTRLLDDVKPREITKLLSSLEHDYWSTHYTLQSKPAKTRLALIGDARVTEMLANVLFPWLITAAPENWERFLDLRAKMSNRRLEIILTRLFGTDPANRARGKRFPRTLAGQQGLLALYNDFCRRDLTDCRQCPFPEQVQEFHGRDDVSSSRS
jgi:hypothetical protein